MGWNGSQVFAIIIPTIFVLAMSILILYSFFQRHKRARLALQDRDTELTVSHQEAPASSVASLPPRPQTPQPALCQPSTPTSLTASSYIAFPPGLDPPGFQHPIRVSFQDPVDLDKSHAFVQRPPSVHHPEYEGSIFSEDVHGPESPSYRLAPSRSEAFPLSRPPSYATLRHSTKSS